MRTLLKNASVLNKEGIYQEVNIFIENGRVINVSEEPIEIDAPIVDMSGYTVMPGFINAHVHIMECFNGFNDDNLKLWLNSGVTTLRDEGILSRHTAADAVTWREKCKKSPIYPTIAVCGRYIAAPGGYGGIDPLGAANEQQARDIVKYQIDSGVDHIKVALEKGYDTWTMGLPMPSDNILGAICDEAHRHGKRVSAHATTYQELERLVNAGIDDAAHISWDDVPDALLEKVVGCGISIVPTLTLYCEISCNTGYPLLAGAMKNTRRFVELGGKIALGDDYMETRKPWFSVGMPMMEIELLQKAGLSMAQVIDAATRGGSYVLGRSDIGRIEQGCIADLIAVKGDPCMVPYLLSAVPWVMKDGVIVKSAN